MEGSRYDERLDASALTTDASEGMVVLDSKLQPIAFGGGAESILEDLRRDSNGDGANAAALPPALRELLQNKHRSDLTAAKMRLSVDNRQYSCRAFAIRPSNGFLNEPLVVLYIKRMSSEKDEARRIAAKYHLTEREQEALIGISLGLTSKELAIRMNISPNTVNSFLRLIMIKMGVTTRSGIVGKLLKQNIQPGT